MTPGDNGKDIIAELLEEGLLRVEKNRRCSSKLVNKISACKQMFQLCPNNKQLLVCLHHLPL